MGQVTMGIVYSTEETPTLENGTMLTSKELDSSNMYTIAVNGLTYATTYYYRSFVQFGGIYRYGETKSFTTLDFSVILQTIDATEIKENTANLRGALTVDSKVPLNIRAWFLYSKDETDVEGLKRNGEKTNVRTLQTQNSQSLEKEFEISLPVTSISSSTEYNYIICAQVWDKTYYGEVKSFEAESVDAEIVTGSASAIDYCSATIAGELNIANSTNLTRIKYFYLSTVKEELDAVRSGNYGYLTCPNTIKRNATSSSTLTRAMAEEFTTTVSGLASGTTYYYLASASVYDRTVYGGIKSFLTDDIEAVVVTEAASDITEFKGTINGSLTIASGENISNSVWLLYSFTPSDLDDLKAKGKKVSVSPNVDGSFSLRLTGLYNQTCYYVACAKVYDKELYGAVKQFTTLVIKPDSTTELTNAEIVSSLEENGGSTSSYADFTFSSASGIWTGYVNTLSTNTFVQIRNSKGAYIMTPTFSTEITKIEFVTDATKGKQSRTIHVMPADFKLPGGKNDADNQDAYNSTSKPSADSPNSKAVADASLGSVATSTTAGETWTIEVTPGHKQVMLIAYDGAVYMSSIKVYCR